MVVKIRYVRPRDIFGQKSTSRAREPVGSYPYRTNSRSVRNPSRWLARKIFFKPISWKVLQDDSVTILHKFVFLIDGGTCSCLAHTTWRFTWRVSRGDIGGASEHGNYLKKFRQIPQYHKKSPNILTRQSAGSKLFRQMTNDKQASKHKLGNRTNRWSKVQADARCPNSKKLLKQQR